MWLNVELVTARESEMLKYAGKLREMEVEMSAKA